MPAKKTAAASTATTKRKTASDGASTARKDVARKAREGAEDFEVGTESLAMAEDLESARVASLAEGLADLSDADELEKVAGRIAQLSDVVAAAGVSSVAEGAAVLSASEDVETMSALVGVMSVDDLEEGLKMARISGELRAVSAITKRLDAPVVASILRDHSEQLDRLAVEAIIRSSSTRVLAAALAATGANLQELSAEDVAEGIVRIATSTALSDESDELVREAEELTIEGDDALRAAEDYDEAAQDALVEGAVGIAVGSAELQEAADEAAVADAAPQSKRRPAKASS